MIRIGETAPTFTLPDSTGRERSLTELLATGPLVLFFYPADFTPICTAEACMFRDRHGDLMRAGVSVVGVSAQSVESHRRFREKNRLEYELLSDCERKVIPSYAGTWMGIRLPFASRRVTYLIGSDGVVRDRVVADLSAASHSRIVAAAQGLRAIS